MSSIILFEACGSCAGIVEGERENTIQVLHSVLLLLLLLLLLILPPLLLQQRILLLGFCPCGNLTNFVPYVTEPGKVAGVP